MARIDDLEERIIELEEYVRELDESTFKTWTMNIDTDDLNYVIGKFMIAYGNGCINRPAGAGNGWIINIPHSSDNLVEKYNKQFWIERIDNKIWMRRQENEVWGSWVQVI